MGLSKLSPVACFCRGMVAGVFALQGLQLVTPDLMMVHAWPWWLRGAVGIVFLLAATNYVLAQRGFMALERYRS